MGKSIADLGIDFLADCAGDSKVRLTQQAQHSVFVWLVLEHFSGEPLTYWTASHIRGEEIPAKPLVNWGECRVLCSGGG